MRRYGFDYVNDDTDRREVIEREHGDWVEAYDAFRAVAEERRQTQRRMIAALYWRAGEYDREADYAQSRGWGEAEIACRVSHAVTRDAAKALEAAL